MNHSGILSVSTLAPEPESGEATPRTARRFTIDGDSALEAHLTHVCQRVLSGVRGIVPAEALEALLLGGGYGRGEGGVLRDSAGDWPYNDMEFYVAIRGNRHLNEIRFRRALEVLGEILTHQADVEIEFKITSLSELRTQAVSMFSYDLIAGHHWLWGDVGALPKLEHHRDAAQIPLSEATRLLMNRGTGLLLARAKLARKALTSDDTDFIRRNIAKAALACGDAVLAARGCYSWSCRERHRQLERIARLEPSQWHEALLYHHRQGVEFKLHPDTRPFSREALEAMHGEVTELMRQCWLWIESRRLNQSFATIRDYVQSPVDKCPETSRARNLAINLRGRLWRLHPAPWRHPRERIFNALACLLWSPESLVERPVLTLMQRDLRTTATTAPDLMRAYESLWPRVR